MQNIIVLYGGKSVEHDISILTAIQTMKNTNRQKYNVIAVYQTKDCEFISPQNPCDIKTYINGVKKFKKVEFLFGEHKIKLGRKILSIYCAVNCCHGAFGEDATLCALMNLCDIPITSCSMLSSSVCMDKIITKDVLVANNIPCVSYMGISYAEYFSQQEQTLKKIQQKLDFPLIVKPSNLGSSIGIEKATNISELANSLDIAFCYDTRVIVEKCLEDFTEINIAVLGNNHCELSQMEKPTNWKDFLNFDDKYTKQSVISKKILNPKLSKPVEQKIKDLAVKCFKVFDLSGNIRIDFLIKDSEVFVNEINTIPGSLAFYLWKGKNIEFFELIDKMIEIAIKKHKQQSLCCFDYKSDVLKSYSENSAKMSK